MEFWVLFYNLVNIQLFLYFCALFLLSRIDKWICEIKCGRTSVKHASRSGRPKSATSPEIVGKFQVSWAKEWMKKVAQWLSSPKEDNSCSIDWKSNGLNFFGVPKIFFRLISVRKVKPSQTNNTRGSWTSWCKKLLKSVLDHPRRKACKASHECYCYGKNLLLFPPCLQELAP